jgi:CheY-like chemotaxis protein
VAKILVADDNSNIQKMVGLALKDQGIDVVAVGNGEAAVRKIADIHPDLVLADVFMPVRNGYEVCRFVKEDPKFAHIPVILLVGAFDPLDEQEAQRVGADGVLKKPFVPPDPLISMVKSALARAGVLIGSAAHAERPPEAPPARPAAEMLTPSAKVTAPAQKIVEAEPEPLEDYPTQPAQVKIAAGHEPVAFGSLLQTPDTEEDDAAFLPKGREELTERTWGTEETEEEEVAEEEETPRGGWRKEDHEGVTEETKGTPDWREAAFHGESPAGSLKSARWTPAVEEPSYAEAAHSPAVAVTTLEEKPADTPAPFSGDAWAAAMAAGVEEKLARAVEEQKVAADTKAVVEEAAKVAEPAKEEEPVKPAEPGNGWYSVTSSPWDAEAKKASLLAATWDTPPVEEPAPAMPEEPVPVEPEPSVEEAAAPVAEEESHYVGSQPETVVGHQENFIEQAGQEESSAPAYVEAPVQVHNAAPAAEIEVEKPAESWQSTESFHADETAAVAETHEEEVAPAPATENKSWENTWEAGGSLPAEKFAEVAHEEAPEVVEERAAVVEEETIAAAETAGGPAPMIGLIAESAAGEVEEEKPDMDALVARVIDQMNPEVLKKMTHEFLRPVIAAVIEEELKSKKS